MVEASLSEGAPRRRTDWLFGIGFGIVAVVTVLAVIGPAIAPYDPTISTPRVAQPPPHIAEWPGLIIAALSGEVLNGKQLDSVKNQIIGLAQLVAESAGGFLGVAKVSGTEEGALAEIAAAFDRADAVVSRQAGD